MGSAPLRQSPRKSARSAILHLVHQKLAERMGRLQRRHIPAPLALHQRLRRHQAQTLYIAARRSIRDSKL